MDNSLYECSLELTWCCQIMGANNITMFVLIRVAVVNFYFRTDNCFSFRFSFVLFEAEGISGITTRSYCNCCVFVFGLSIVLYHDSFV